MDGDRRRGSGRPAQDKRGLAPIAVIAMILVAVGFFSSAVYGIGFAIRTYMPNFRRMDYYEFHEDLDSDRINITLEDEILLSGYHPVIEGGEIYLPVDFVKAHVDKYIYWDEQTRRLTITNEYDVIRMNTDDLTAYVNDRPISLNLAVYYIDGTAYMPGLFLKDHYNIEINYHEENNMVWVDYGEKDKEKSVTEAKNTYFRFEPDKKSPVIEKLPAQTEVYIYEETNGYTRIRLMDGRVGYVLTENLGETETIGGFIPSDNPPELKAPKPINGKINMVWDMMAKVEENSMEKSRIVHPGLDVLSPQWFRFDRESYSGEILSIADLGYMNWAHDNGYQVWAMLSDEEDGEVTAQILSDQEKREGVIRQILGFVAMYDIDGINIDFERVREADIVYFHQFLRELWPLLKEQGVILSVDTFVPSAWSMYYSRGEIAATVDYVCVMTYDENTYGDISGPNASIGFVENGVVNTLAEVPAEKLIMGIPFYSRVWIETETPDGIDYKIRSLGMDYAYRLFVEENGAELEWLPDLGCYYAEAYIIDRDDGVLKLHRTWLEDERSLMEKMKIVNQYDLAGVCAWVRGLQNEATWTVLSEALKQ